MNPFQVTSTTIEGCVQIQPRVFEDSRGKFVKLFHREAFLEHGLEARYEEEYYSVSPQSVLRGLHFQIPPMEHVKLVGCVRGVILDVVYDLRKDSPTYGKVHSQELSAGRANMLYVPPGLAHGFYVLEGPATFVSMNSRKFSPECDRGVRWDSIPFQWPDSDPVVSEKDRNMPPVYQFDNPF